jgi:hypothetical protein
VSADYLKDLFRFASSDPFVREDGSRFYLSHKDDIDPNLMVTDGEGNIVSVPLFYGKPCQGRPERRIRAEFDRKYYRRDDGERVLSPTPCDTCHHSSPGVFQACSRAVLERITSDPAIKQSVKKWVLACGAERGATCFLGERGKLWHEVLAAIKAHGGWTNINDDQVKLEALRRLDQKQKRDRDNRAKRRDAEKAQRRGDTRLITEDFCRKLSIEAGLRASHLKRLMNASGRTPADMRPWKMLKDAGCDRIASVWEAREILRRAKREPTGQAIAELLWRRGTLSFNSFGSLRARVYEDLRRLKRLEDSTNGAPLWEQWRYS